MARKKNGGPRLNPNTPVAPAGPGQRFAERKAVEENPNTPVAPETPDAPNAIPFADRSADAVDEGAEE